MTAPARVFIPSPERCWEIAIEGGVRMNRESKAQALVHAATQVEANWRFIGESENWVTIRRLMKPSVRAEEFGSLVAAVAAGCGPQIKTVAETLVGAS